MGRDREQQQGMRYKDRDATASRPADLESGLVPLPEPDNLIKAGQRSGEGLSSILPYLVKSLRSKPRAASPTPQGGASKPPPTSR